MMDREEHEQLEEINYLLLDFCAPVFSKDSISVALLKLHHDCAVGIE